MSRPDMYRNEDGSLKTVQELREQKGDLYPFLKFSLFHMFDRPFEHCIDAFNHPSEELDINKWVDDFARDHDTHDAKDHITHVCAFAGIVRALNEQRETGEMKEYEEEEPKIFMDGALLGETMKINHQRMTYFMASNLGQF